MTIAKPTSIAFYAMDLSNNSNWPKKQNTTSNTNKSMTEGIKLFLQSSTFKQQEKERQKNSKRPILETKPNQTPNIPNLFFLRTQLRKPRIVQGGSHESLKISKIKHMHCFLFHPFLFALSSCKCNHPPRRNLRFSLSASLSQSCVISLTVLRPATTASIPFSNFADKFNDDGGGKNGVIVVVMTDLGSVLSRQSYDPIWAQFRMDMERAMMKMVNDVDDGGGRRWLAVNKEATSPPNPSLESVLAYSCLKGVIKESDRYFLFCASFCVTNLLKTDENGWNVD
ncbi:hypothetical protein MTR_2g090455 [Medicago truncatula]|uniref:Uncharacterized protein n=1 Tax=Medicago truncatula TaxID=3880 RepID=A0A072VC09_MEDTR|nr:hypothetical protein MTR_2g090455 [Medicago truncatula]